MDLKLLLAIIPPIIFLFSMVPYIRDIFKGTTKPHPYTWLIWTVTQGTATLAMISGGAGWGSLQFIVSTLACAVVFFLSINKGREYITSFDTMCLLLAIVAFGVYLGPHNLVLSVTLATLVDVIGYVPTWRKTFLEPESETVSMYLLENLSIFIAMLALSSYNYITLFYPVTFFICNAILAAIILWPRKQTVIN